METCMSEVKSEAAGCWPMGIRQITLGLLCTCAKRLFMAAKFRSFESATKRLALTTINTNVGEYFGMGVVLNTVSKNICSHLKGAWSQRATRTTPSRYEDLLLSPPAPGLRLVCIKLWGLQRFCPNSYPPPPKIRGHLNVMEEVVRNEAILLGGCSCLWLLHVICPVI